MFSPPSYAARSGLWWKLAMFGQFVLVFSALALSGPGRIDIDDGQTRFEVAQNLVDHGDPAVRDRDIWYTILPGRNGGRYSNYRLPQSAAGAVAVWLADATGPVRESRRHFFFSLTSAFAGAVLAVAYAVLFRALGRSGASALFWATAGVFCTPSWFYGTSTFDDILGTATLLLAVTVAFTTRHQRPLLGAAAAGLVLGVAFNCKQPLAIFVLAILAANHDRKLALRAQVGRVALTLAGLAVGVVFYKGYELYKFPPETTAAHAEILKRWGPVWTSNPLPGLISLTVSPGAGCLWYCPTLLLSVLGLAHWYRSEKAFCLAALAGSAVFVGFISFLTFFKGDMTWGPRYLTPIFALFWLFAPAGAALVRPRLATLVLLAGLGVQLLGLSVDPHRLYLQRHLWSTFFITDPWVYFDPAVSHLANRPREIAEIVGSGEPPAAAFTPARSPTYCLPILDYILEGPAGVHKYHVLNSLRPWWISQRYLAPEARPVDLAFTATLLACGLLGGLLVMLGAGRKGPAENLPPPGS